MNEREKVLATEFSPEFVAKMQNAMVLSYYKYGLLTEGYPDKVDAISSLMTRLEKYAKTGNTEYLVDVANFAMIEFMLPRHPDAHYKAEDSLASPGRVSAEDGRLSHRSNEGKDLKVGYSEKSSMANMRALLNQTGVD